MDGVAVGPYRLDARQQIGSGAGCVGVYRAVDTRSGRVVAIKTIDRASHADTRWKHSFQREMDIASKLRHPNVIELVDVVAWQNYVCLVMEYASGGELFQVISDSGAMSEDMARGYFLQILSAVEYCHSCGVCHRDLKLENILLSEQGSQLVKITDFGMSKDIEQHSIPKTKRVGTASYMAPEVSMAGVATPYDGTAADVWSLGVILYVLVCCDYPFGFDGPGGASTHHVLARVAKGKFQFPDQVSSGVSLSADLKSLVMGMLTVDTSQRLTIAQAAAHQWSTTGHYIPDATVAESPTMVIDWAAMEEEMRLSDKPLMPLGSFASSDEFGFDFARLDSSDPILDDAF